jgi:hypothetical protein
MKAYKNIKLSQYPDILDILTEGRKSSVGRLRPGTVYVKYRNNIVSDKNAIIKVSRDTRGYCSPKKKKSTRRYLKRVDRRIENEFNIKAED